MTKKLEIYLDRLYQFTSTKKFFYVILALFLLNSLWLVFSAVYPLPFDEYYHFEIIQIYANQYSPIINTQTPAADMLGDITREPSYLYHYLMSFPYRLFDLFLDSRMSLVIALRLINVAFVAAALFLFRKLFLAWELSPRVAHIAILAFISTPIIPLISAHVNYDNLMFLGAPLFFLTATRLIKGDKRLATNLILFASLALTIVLVKRTFLPVVALTSGYLAVLIIKQYGSNIFSEIRKYWRDRANSIVALGLIIWVLLGAGLFVERYGINIIRYGDMWPSCDKIQPVEVCSNWGPWRRDNIDIAWLRPAEPPFGNIFSFGQHWVSWIVEGNYVLFSHKAGADPKLGDPYGTIEGAGWLPVPKFVGSAALFMGVVLIILNIKKIWRNPYLRFALVIAVGFLFMQFLWNYRTYLKLWRPVAAQARYAYPILMLLFAVMIQSASWQFKNAKLKGLAVAVFLLFYVWGGGSAGWIIRSPETWEWQRPLVHDVNNTASNILQRIVVN